MEKVIRITYCVECNLLPVATGLAQAFKDKFSIKTELIEGHNGIFKITMNDDLIYNHKKDDKPPTNEFLFNQIERFVK